MVRNSDDDFIGEVNKFSIDQQQGIILMDIALTLREILRNVKKKKKR